MLGVIAGDIIGSSHERSPRKTTHFALFDSHSRFTDDSVLTLATAHAILTGQSYESAYREFGRRYPDAGYGGSFFQWLFTPHSRPYQSWGNGSAMRVAPIGLAFDTTDQVLREAERSASVTHDHPEGIRGAQATALAVFIARTGGSREEIRREISRRFGYDLERTVDDIRPNYAFDVSCQGSVPEAIVAFLDSTDFESSVRLAVSLGGDSDTQAAIAGGIAHAFYRDVPSAIAAGVRERLPTDLIAVLDAFSAAYPLGSKG